CDPAPPPAATPDPGSGGVNEMLPPTLTHPGNSSTWGGSSVTFKWNASPSANIDVYTIRVVDDPRKIDSGPWIFDGGVDAPTTEKTISLSNGEYYWAVWACRGCKSGANQYSNRAGPWKVTVSTSLPAPP